MFLQIRCIYVLSAIGNVTRFHVTQVSLVKWKRMYSKIKKSASVTLWLIALLISGSKSRAKPLTEKINGLKTWCLENSCYSSTFFRDLDESCGSQLSVRFDTKISDSQTELVLATTNCKNGLICENSICKSKDISESKISLSSEFSRRSARQNSRKDETDYGKIRENNDFFDYLYLEDDIIRIQDENYDNLIESSKDKIIEISDQDLEDRIIELETSIPVIFRPKKAAFDNRGFDNVRKRGADNEPKYGSFKFDLEDKTLSQSPVADIYLLTVATASLSRVLFKTKSPERQYYQTVLINEENESNNDNFGNSVRIQLNGIEYKLIYKQNMMDELNLLLSTIKMKSAEEENTKLLYNLFKYYLEQKSLFQKLGLRFQWSSFEIFIPENRRDTEPVFTNFIFGPTLDNSKLYNQRKKRESENPSFDSSESEIEFATPKSIQDILKYIKTNKDDKAQYSRMSETPKKMNENHYINFDNMKIENDLIRDRKLKALLESDDSNRDNSDNKDNEWKNTSDRDAQNNNLTLKIFKTFINDSIAGFKVQLKRIEKQIGGIERKIDSAKICERDMDLNGNVFTSSAEKLQKIESTNDRNRSSKKFQRINGVLNRDKLIQEILARNNLNVRKRVSESETRSTIPVDNAPPRKEKLVPLINAFNQQHRNLRRPNSPNISIPNFSRYSGSSGELSRNDGLKMDQVMRSQGLLRNRGLSRSQGNEDFLRNYEDSRNRLSSVNQGLLRNQELSRNKDRFGAIRSMEEDLRYAKMVSDLRNLRHGRIDYNPEESLFYRDNLKEIPRFVEPFRQLRKRESLNQDPSDKDKPHINRSTFSEDHKKNISDPLSNLFLNTSSKDNFRTRWPIHSSSTSWKMFIAKKDSDFPRRVQLQRTKSSPAGLIVPLNQEEKLGHQETRKEVIRKPSPLDHLDYPQGQGYVTLGGNLSWNGDQSRLLHDLTLNESHSPAAVYQPDNRNNYSSGIENNGEYFLSIFRSSSVENLKMGNTNLTTFKKNETHLNRDFNKDVEKTDLLEKRKIFRSINAPRSKRSMRRFVSPHDYRRRLEEEMISSVFEKAVPDSHFGLFKKEDSFNLQNKKKELNNEGIGFVDELSAESLEDKLQTTSNFADLNEDLAHMCESDISEEDLDFVDSNIQDSSILMDKMEYLDGSELYFRKKRNPIEERKQGLK